MRPLRPTAASALAHLALLTAATVAGCRTPTPAAPPPGTPPASSATGPGTGATVDPAALTGRLVCIVASGEGVSNRAVAVDMATGEQTELWQSTEGANLADWKVSPDGTIVAYRVIQRSAVTDAVEAIVLRGLTVGARPRIVASVDASFQRLAGFAWSADGSEIGYGVETLPVAAGEAVEAKAGEWRLHSLAVPDLNDDSQFPPKFRALFHSALPEQQPLSWNLLTFDPQLKRSVVAELAADSGLLAQLTVHDWANGTARTLPLKIGSAVPAVRGQRVLVVEDGATATDTKIWLVDLRTDEPLYVANRYEDGEQWSNPIMSKDGNRMAVAEFKGIRGGKPNGLVRVLDLPSAESWVGGIVVRGSEEHGFSGLASGPLAFSPDGFHVLTQVAEVGDAFAARLSVISLDQRTYLNATLPYLPWSAPPGTWALDWVP